MEMIHFCFLKGPRDKEDCRPMMSKSLEELNLTVEQALEVCMELNNHETIAAWITGGSVNKNATKDEMDW